MAKQSKSNSEKKLAEQQRLDESASREANWQRWGPYLSERQWGTVREDYSANGDCWNYFPHDHARSRTYRWGEDGLLGICDRECRLCFAWAFWNGRDPILKERFFGLTNTEGNHGEDVKECYYFLDASPTNSYLKALYKYPQAAFPYQQLIDENARRSVHDRECELADLGVFDDGRYFDMHVEYAKAGPDDMLICLTITNRGPEAADLHVLPTLWFRNTWSWGDGHRDEEDWGKPRLTLTDEGDVLAEHKSLGRFRLTMDESGPSPPERLRSGLDASGGWLFTENETNSHRLYGSSNATPYVKDAFHRRIVHGERGAVNPGHEGTKAAAWCQLHLDAGQTVQLKLRLTSEENRPNEAFGQGFEDVFEQRIADTDAFYQPLLSDKRTEESRIARQAYAGLLWSKNFYQYVVRQWLKGDDNQPPPPASRRDGRNADWPHLYNRDVISMPDPWEYPWYASWDLAFHMICFARIDPAFAKRQLLTMLREWYMHPNGAMPAYEFNFSDANPPVHAWACWRVYKMSAPRGQRDRLFLERTFQKLLFNFTWWVNRKDSMGRHLFSGGFLGLDNIGLFDRSQPLADGAILNQADATAWMAFYCGTMLSMALELAEPGNAYEDLASKFFEHYVRIADAINDLGGTGLWDEAEGFYYDHLRVGERVTPIKARSLVGLVPLIAVEIIREEVFERLPNFHKRTEWFLRHRKDLTNHISYMESCQGDRGHILLAMPSRQRLERVLGYMLNEAEFLSPFGIRSLSRHYREHPYTLTIDGQEHRIDYDPGESTTSLFGGNSNWRGPVWFPLNFLLIEALERYHHFYEDGFKVEYPTGSGRQCNLREVANDLRRRLVALFLPDDQGRRPYQRDFPLADDPAWRDLLLFNEYFDGDTGRGCGASHQTGWTALVTQCVGMR